MVPILDAKDTIISPQTAQRRDSGRILKKLTDIMADKIARYRRKGRNTPIRAMVVGIPNSGKSTLIKLPVRRKKDYNGRRPGVYEKQTMAAVCKGVDMLDTPGTLWPKMRRPANLPSILLYRQYKGRYFRLGRSGRKPYKIFIR